ncbi:5-oxoprolinase subunit PxpB [Burkholderia gladioli]|uniref:5-oxoprolinase subunit PxpB n=1 Tax=Burkholderia gladioli TaxID=28095 RepID=UPI0015E6AEEA|nr:5-oxoprolinase subunit PxpB [Burkholderia gladioli]MBA1361122.1 5-oxoprolinase subunit PxpB [Burkholderia gladioli]
MRHSLPAQPAPADGATRWTLAPSGERLLIVDLHAPDLRRANLAARRAAAAIGAARLPFVLDIVPAMATVGVHYALERVPFTRADGSPYVALERLVGACLTEAWQAGAGHADEAEAGRVIEIPICYGGLHGPDLAGVAQACGITESEVIRRHSASLVDVMMLGFAPGHPYLGLFDPALAVARRATPRTSVASGSVGLANRQSVIYPSMLPGGWNVIGRTPLTLFDATRETPCLVAAGDRVRFVPIGEDEFRAANEHLPRKAA